MSELAVEYQTAGKSNVTLSQDANVVYLSGNNNSNIDSGERVMPHINISVSRFGFGESSTLSQFAAYAYDEYGHLVDVLEGYFLEPYFDPDRCYTEGSNTAIPGGKYQIEPSLFDGKSGYYEVMNVSGRGAIKIHSGNHGGDTRGCLLTGASYTYNGANNEYDVWNSGDKLNEFRAFMSKYGSGFATMTIFP